MEAMKHIPDKFFQLAITDPPYGIGIDGQKLSINKNPNMINDKEIRKRIDPEDLAFMNKELGRQAGAIWARLLRALKKHDFAAAEEVIRGKRGAAVEQ